MGQLHAPDASDVGGNMSKWIRYFVMLLVFLYGSLNILVALFAVPAATPNNVSEIEGIFQRTFVGGDQDVVIELQDSTRRFYINRGFDDHPHFAAAAFEAEVSAGDVVILTAYNRWLAEEGEAQRAATPLAGIRTPEKVYLDSAWMAESDVVSNGWLVGLAMYALLFLLLLPNIRQRNVERQQLALS